MLSDAKKKANAKWDKAHMMILGCKVRKDFAAQFREALSLIHISEPTRRS